MVGKILAKGCSECQTNFLTPPNLPFGFAELFVHASLQRRAGTERFGRGLRRKLQAIFSLTLTQYYDV